MRSTVSNLDAMPTSELWALDQAVTSALILRLSKRELEVEQLLHALGRVSRPAKASKSAMSKDLHQISQC